MNIANINLKGIFLKIMDKEKIKKIVREHIILTYKNGYILLNCSLEELIEEINEKL